MSHEARQVEVAEQVTLVGVDRLCDFYSLFRIFPQRLHLGLEQLIVGVGMSPALEYEGCIILHKAPEGPRKYVHTVCVDELGPELVLSRSVRQRWLTHLPYLLGLLVPLRPILLGCQLAQQQEDLGNDNLR